MLEKYVILILSIFLVLCAGSCNIYPIYITKIEDRFGFSISEINLFGTFINLGLWVAFPMGFLYDRLGPKISTLIGLFFLSGSYFLLHFIINYDFFLNLSIYPMLLLGWTMGQGSALCYLTALNTNLKNFKFKQSSGIVGLLAANIAISPSIFITFKQNIKLFTLVNFFFIHAIFLSVVILLCTIIFHNLKNIYSEDKITRAYEKYKEKKIVRVMIFFNFFNLFIYIFSVFYNYYMDKYIIPIILIYPAILLLNFSIIVLEKNKIFDKFYFESFKNKIKSTAIKSAIELETKFNNQFVGKKDKSLDKLFLNESLPRYTSSNSKSQTEYLNIFDSIFSKKFLLVFIILVLGIGSVISNLNNIHFLLKSIRVKKHIKTENKNVIYHDKELFFFVILYFVFNSTTRLVSGLILDYLITKRRIFTYLLFFSIVGCISQILGILMDYNFLCFSISLAGTTHGGYMTFVPVFTKNQYGLKNIGVLFGCLTTGCAIGSLLISDFIFITPYNYFGINGRCDGPICFSPSYMITSTFFIINICLSFYLSNSEYIKERNEIINEKDNRKINTIN